MIRYIYGDLSQYEWYPSHLDGHYLQRIDEDGTIWSIPFDSANGDYKNYLLWLEEGNEPEPWVNPDSLNLEGS